MCIVFYTYRSVYFILRRSFRTSGHSQSGLRHQYSRVSMFSILIHMCAQVRVPRPQSSPTILPRVVVKPRSHMWHDAFICVAWMSHPRMSYERVISHIWMSHVTHVNESYHTCEWVMLHIWMSHVTHVNESCHTYEWVMSHMWMSHITHWNVSNTHIRITGLFCKRAL